jgi:hypothetical protein
MKIITVVKIVNQEKSNLLNYVNAKDLAGSYILYVSKDGLDRNQSLKRKVT